MFQKTSEAEDQYDEDNEELSESRLEPGLRSNKDEAETPDEVWRTGDREDVRDSLCITCIRNNENSDVLPFYRFVSSFSCHWLSVSSLELFYPS